MMKFHIVRNQETTKEILDIYSLTITELKEANRHVRDWNKLIPGTKIKIPIINEATDQDIIDMEPFIEDYYPRSEDPFFQNDKQAFDEQINHQFSDDFASNESKSEIKDSENDQTNNDSNPIEVFKEVEINDEIKETTTNQKVTQKDTNKKEMNNRQSELKSKQIIGNPKQQGFNISYVWYQPYPVYYPIYIKVK